jgi:hypothetical protein
MDDMLAERQHAGQIWRGRVVEGGGSP